MNVQWMSRKAKQIYFIYRNGSETDPVHQKSLEKEMRSSRKETRRKEGKLRKMSLKSVDSAGGTTIISSFSFVAFIHCCCCCYFFSSSSPCFSSRLVWYFVAAVDGPVFQSLDVECCCGCVSVNESGSPLTVSQFGLVLFLDSLFIHPTHEEKRERERSLIILSHLLVYLE